MPLSRPFWVVAGVAIAAQIGESLRRPNHARTINVWNDAKLDCNSQRIVSPSTVIANSTTLVLGAGASHAYGFPVGAELSELLCSNELRTRMEPLIAGGDIQEFQTRFRNSQVNSIDHFLNLNPDLDTPGRLAVCAALTQYERPEKLYGGWYQTLWNHLITESEGERQKLSIVTFNYDRSLEFFLLRSIYSTFKLSERDWGHKRMAKEKLLEMVDILHVYGDLGSLPEMLEERPTLEYGDTNVDRIPETYKCLHLIGRKDSEKAQFGRAVDLLRGSKFVCFLGFGFLEENIKGLDFQSVFNPKTSPHVGTVFSSAFGLGTGRKARLRELYPVEWHFGSSSDDAGAFLNETDFLGWAGMLNGNPRKLAESLNPSLYERAQHSRNVVASFRKAPTRSLRSPNS